MKVKELVKKGNEHCDLAPWQTHYPLIIGALNNLQPLTIVECGAGNYSGMAFTSYLAGNKLATCLTLENHKEWIEGLDWQKSYRHIFKFVDGWNMHELFSDYTCDLAFIDQEPEESRINCLDFWRTRAKVVIQHDSQYPQRYGCIWEKFNYIVHDKRLPMNTTICSMNIDVTEWWQ